jgi:hypothetical protein
MERALFYRPVAFALIDKISLTDTTIIYNIYENYRQTCPRMGDAMVSGFL